MTHHLIAKPDTASLKPASIAARSNDAVPQAYRRALADNCLDNVGSTR
jgi:hypothetical protein